MFSQVPKHHISEIFDALEMKAKKRSVSLSVNNQSTNNFVEADRDKISQVLINLIENSIKYGNEGGHTKVRIFDMGENSSIFPVIRSSNLAPMLIKRSQSCIALFAS